MVDGFHAGIKFSITRNNLTLEEVSLVILLVSEITILIWWKVGKKSGKVVNMATCFASHRKEGGWGRHFSAIFSFG